MADISTIPNFHLKVVFIAHFILIAFSTMGAWNTSSYFLYNLILLLTLLWAIHKNDSDEPIQMAIVVNAIAIVLDIIILAMCYPSNPIFSVAREKFSAAIAIVHLIVRPFSCLFLAKILQERNNALGGGMGNLFAAPRNQNYEDMDKTAQATHSNQGGYDFTAAQQI